MTTLPRPIRRLLAATDLTNDKGDCSAQAVGAMFLLVVLALASVGSAAGVGVWLGVHAGWWASVGWAVLVLVPAYRVVTRGVDA